MGDVHLSHSGDRLASLLMFLDPSSAVTRIIMTVFLVGWFCYLASLIGARVELGHSAVETHGPPYAVYGQFFRPGERPWLLYVIVALFVFDVGVLMLGYPPRQVRRLLLIVRVVYLGAALVRTAQVPESGRRTIRYAEITKAPWEDTLGPNKWRVLRMSVAGREESFTFPSWLSARSRREIAGRVAAQVRMAHAPAGAPHKPVAGSADEVPAAQSDSLTCAC
jgi:hypothetical protein